ncbi:MAG: hypothetical protein ACTS3F_04325 [Phycisphaerales bacterium]
MPTGQLIILALFFGITAISWIANKLREQAEIKRIRDEMRRREEEALRSTNVMRREEADAAVAQGAKTPMQVRMEELAARRQAQLRELRERQAREAQQQRQGGARQPGVLLPGGRAGAPTPTRPGPRPIPGAQRQPTTRAPQRPPVSIPGRTPGRSAPQRPTPSTRPEPVPTPRQREEAALRQAPPIADRSEEAPSTPIQRQEIDTSALSMIESTAIGEGRPRKARRAVSTVSADVRALLGRAPGADPHQRLRRQRALLAAAEVIGTPAAFRDDAQSPWNRIA